MAFQGNYPQTGQIPVSQNNFQYAQPYGGFNIQSLLGDALGNPLTSQALGNAANPLNFASYFNQQGGGNTQQGFNTTVGDPAQMMMAQYAPLLQQYIHGLGGDLLSAAGDVSGQGFANHGGAGQGNIFDAQLSAQVAPVLMNLMSNAQNQFLSSDQTAINQQNSLGQMVAGALTQAGLRPGQYLTPRPGFNSNNQGNGNNPFSQQLDTSGMFGGVPPLGQGNQNPAAAGNSNANTNTNPPNTNTNTQTTPPDPNTDTSFDAAKQAIMNLITGTGIMNLGDYTGFGPIAQYGGPIGMGSYAPAVGMGDPSFSQAVGGYDVMSGMSDMSSWNTGP